MTKINGALETSNPLYLFGLYVYADVGMYIPCAFMVIQPCVFITFMNKDMETYM